MFTEGFEKVAIILPAMQKVRGWGARAIGGATKAVKQFATSQKEKGVSAYRAGKAGKARVAGESLYNVRATKAARQGRSPGSIGESEALAKKSKGDVFARQKKMKESAEARKPSFAKKHPFITAGGLYLGTRAAFGGGEDKQQQQQPQYVGPQ